MCGKLIKPEDDGLLVRTYGKISWNDKSTGAERSKFGSMYIHSNQKCLENSDSETFYFLKVFMMIDDKTKEKLNKSEVALLKNFSYNLVYFMIITSSTLSCVFITLLKSYNFSFLSRWYRLNNFEFGNKVSTGNNFQTF